MTTKVQVLNEDHSLIGYVGLRDEEIRHFDSCGSVPAKIALDRDQLATLNLDDNDYIYIRA